MHSAAVEIKELALVLFLTRFSSWMPEPVQILLAAQFSANQDGISCRDRLNLDSDGAGYSIRIGQGGDFSCAIQSHR